MKKKNITLIILLSTFFLSGCTLPSIFQKKNAAISVTTTHKGQPHKAQVYLNGEKVGETPFGSQELKAEEYSVRLVAEDGELSEWETSVNLYSGITTVVIYDFAKERQDASGTTLTLEPLASKDVVEVAVVSLPDSSSIKIDGQPKGFTPLQVKSLSAGEHTLSVSAPGYKQLEQGIKTVAGYKLTIEVQLAKESLEIEEATESAEDKNQTTEDEQEQSDEIVKKPTTSKTASSSAEPERPYVEILETPTGWLRVRSEPTTAEDNEVAKINPGEKYPFLEANDTGWYKILLSDKNEGWISGRYATLFK